jgi:hypothetical protein
LENLIEVTMLRKILLICAIILMGNFAIAEEISENSPEVDAELKQIDAEQAPKAEPKPVAPKAETKPAAPKDTEPTPPPAQPNQDKTEKKSSINDGVRAGDVYNSCKDYFNNTFNTKENISKRATCNGYFFGVGGTLLTLKASGVDTKICIPNDISTHQIIQAFLDWAKINEAGLVIKAADGTLKALADRYPCGK